MINEMGKLFFWVDEMKAKVIGIDGSAKESIELPEVFTSSYQPRLIKRAVLALQTSKKQAKGSDPRAGKKNTAIYVGTRDQPTMERTINVEHARLPRMKNRNSLLQGRVARVPHSVGGMSAHPPKAWTTIVEKINKKERKVALRSAIAATTMKELVKKRFIFEKELPIIIVNDFEETNKTKEIVSILGKIGVGEDIKNAKEKTKKRAGRGKTRGRTKKIKKSVLIITGKNSPVLKAARNLPGVDAVTVNSLNVDLLAPGAEAGRLVVWTTGAIEALGEKFSGNIKEAKIKKKKSVKAKRQKTVKTKKAEKTSEKKESKIKK